MLWTFSLYEYIEFVKDAPFPCTKIELLDYAQRMGFSMAVIENLKELDDDGEEYQDPYDLWPNMPSYDDEFEWETSMN